MNWRLRLILPPDAYLKDVATPSSDLKSKEVSNYQDMSGLTALIFLMKANLPKQQKYSVERMEKSSVTFLRSLGSCLFLVQCQ